MSGIKGDRREVICAAAVQLLASGGAHALSHGAIDRSLGLPAGSTSYYYRTRRSLVLAVATHIAARSRAELEAALTSPSPDPSTASATEVIAGQLARLILARRDEALARYCLLLEAAGDDELTELLVSCLFSRKLAAELLAQLGANEPHDAADDLVALLEGLLFDSVVGARSRDPQDEAALAHRLRLPIRAALPLSSRCAAPVTAGRPVDSALGPQRLETVSANGQLLES